MIINQDQDLVYATLPSIVVKFRCGLVLSTKHASTLCNTIGPKTFTQSLTCFPRVLNDTLHFEREVCVEGDGDVLTSRGEGRGEGKLGGKRLEVITSTIH